MIIKVINKIIHKLGYTLVNNKDLNVFSTIPKFAFLWNKFDNEEKEFISKYLPFSKSQYGQDLFVLSRHLKKNIPNFFVEFGATDGIELSNTYVLEKCLNWQGILAEPAKIWHKDLTSNRNCKIDLRCVYNISNSFVEFAETLNSNEQFKISGPALSTIKKYTTNGDWASEARQFNSETYKVETITLMDLLDQNNAPNKIGYISIDTEGSEFEILEKFDFKKYQISVFTIEHNSDVKKRNMIFQLLSTNGFSRVNSDISGPDDWYINDKY